MKVYVIPADAYACGHYRIIWPADVLRRCGMDITIIPPNEQSGFMVRVEDDDRIPGGKRIVEAGIPKDADVIVMQRPAHPMQPQLIRLLRDNGIAVVVDMDDDMSSIHPDNVAFRTYHPKSSTPFSWQHAATSCNEATLVTTSTAALARTYAKHGRSVVLDNYVPAATLESVSTGTGFGWAGTTSSHPNDLQTMGNVVQRLRDDGFDFTVVGGMSKVRQAARLSSDPVCTGTVGLDVWIKTIAATYQVGIIPLAPTAFNTAKSRLKGIEHFAAKVPWVAAPRAEYRRLVKESGAGLLADTPKQWYELTKRLLTDEVLRKEQVEAGIEFMRDQTYQAQSWRWAEAWERAVKIQRGL
jgi:Glycosyl transferases group 1